MNSPAYNWKNKTILIAEDIYNSYQLLVNILSKTKAKTMLAVNGEEAVELCKEYPDIDLVLMDIRMPKLDGYKATKLIKKFRKDLPIIAQTAYSMIGDQQKAIEVGCDDFITKPIKATELLEKIAKLI
ncbi:MAG: response regulator [Bacteroidales bacterium]|nr:response regulator [Bacteroidales bacterium]